MPLPHLRCVAGHCTYWLDSRLYLFRNNCTFRSHAKDKDIRAEGELS